MSRQERLREYKRQAGPSGESRNQSTLDYWSNRASENSLHPGKKKPAPTHGLGREEINHEGGTFLPGVTRNET
ncbi:hypothetical protein ACQR1Y_12470 [Bradyrhizobium sp. HKCCYLRH3099]|uniref:hypothetical protein n=1 Tax=Bradyrhizobium TaxID=374 RepID=UPI003EBCBA10